MISRTETGILGAAIIGSVFFFASSAIAANTFELGRGSRPNIAAGSNDRVYVVFEGHRPGLETQNIYFAKSLDGAKTWSPAVNISQASAGSCLTPAIAVEKDGALDVVWSDTSSDGASADIHFAHSEDAGDTWTKPVDIEPMAGVASAPAIAVGPDQSIHVIWSDSCAGEQHKDIYYTSSSDSGKTWGRDSLLPDINISKTSGSATEAAIAVGAGGIVHAAWLDTTPGETHPDIYYAQLVNNLWSKPLNVSHSPRLSSHPWLACGPNGRVFLSWRDNSKRQTAADIWCAISDGHGHFGKPLNLSDTSGTSSEPNIAADQDGRVGVVWTDTGAGLTHPDIHGRFSLDSGNDFSVVMDLSGHTAGTSKHPGATISGNTMFVVWEELENEKSILKVASMELKSVPSTAAKQVYP